ncbi:MAG TPA: transposase, partial [Oligoflexus sp.]|uniref:IS66 family transposase n=1 Tax=Oligoflexus sp. TaxID=1971216 RepID=UPI002D7086CA
MTQHIDIELQGLRQLQSRIEEQRLDPDDWKVFAALVMNLADRAEARVSRMVAKILAADAAGNGEGIDQQPMASERSDSDAPEPDQTSAGEAASSNPASSSVEAEKDSAKGHGRNGFKAYTNATHIHHSLLCGRAGALCEGCKAGPMSRYREKVIVRIVGQPNFGAEVHHFEQARCKLCGQITRAEVPADVTAGIGSSYINYHWSACAMLSVMHYFAGMPFKRLENLHRGWGITMADANQWNIVDEADTLLQPLFKALEGYAIEEGTSLLIDDTGSKVIAIQRQINAEIKALETAGLSIKSVRTGINATGVYIETLE